MRFLDNYLGLLWVFIHPVVMLFILWFIFEIGFKSKPVGDIEFSLWLICGMVPWLFIADSINHATHSITAQSYLVKKVVFKVSLLPLIKIGSSLIIHIFFIFVIVFLFMVYGYSPKAHYIQLLYYMGSAILLVLGLSWLTSAFNVFVRDTGQLVTIGVQIGFWGTPIFWSLNLIPKEYHFYLKLNPAFYIVQGYRDSFIVSTWFWEKPALSLYYWGFTLIILGIGAFLFRKLRPHFADVL